MIKDKFQYLVIGVFVLIAIIGIAMFATGGKNKNNSTGPNGTVTMWGTISPTYMSKQLGEYTSDKETYGVTYVQKSPLTFRQDLIEAFASGKGPDLIIITPELLWSLHDKITEIPFASYPQRSFIDGYISGAQVFLSSTGVSALPFRVDPLVMYYNRTMLESKFVINPPKYWDDMYTFVQSITERNTDNIIQTSAVSLGAWDNIENAKDILATLLLQSGVTITQRTENSLEVTLKDSVGNKSSSVLPAQSTVTYYSEFANPSSLYYSWNEAKPNSRDAFISGTLALYFGYASELPTIRAKNPNLDFDIAMMPQIESVATRAVYGDMYAIAVSKFSKNPITAVTVARDITDKAFVESIASNDYAAPMLKSLIGVKTASDPYRTTIYQSALVAKSWIDPNPVTSDPVFKNMIKAYTSGAKDARRAVEEADENLSLLVK
ncbi:MAG: extracellular solute-binding protein [Candidatus Pacebacteria bacterium]|nr:extracellular solute-binding protein [Candidatus Paceibacterota bacterium]